MATTVQPKPWHIVCLALFALPFAAIGVWSGIEAGREIAAYRRMQGWQETPAKILQTELKTDCDGEGCTNWVTAEYAYTYQGRQYTGHRVSMHGGSDNVGSFQEDAYRQLREHKISGRPFRCYVNPERPAEAPLPRPARGNGRLQSGFYRRIRRSGLRAVDGRCRRLSHYASRRHRHRLHPPALAAQKDGADNRIRSTTGRSSLILSAVAFYWNLFSAPAWYVFCNDLFAKGICSSPGVLIFPMFGSVLIVVAAVPILRRCKYGRSVFQMAAVPGVIGGQLAGVILVPRKVRPKDGFRVTLKRVDKFTQSDGDYNVASHDIVWQDQQIVSRDLRQTDPGQTAIPVLFHIPYGCRRRRNEHVQQDDMAASMLGEDAGAWLHRRVRRAGIQNAGERSKFRVRSRPWPNTLRCGLPKGSFLRRALWKPPCPRATAAGSFFPLVGMPPVPCCSWWFGSYGPGSLFSYGVREGRSSASFCSGCSG